MFTEPKPLTLLQWLWIKWCSFSLNNVLFFLEPTEIVAYRILWICMQLYNSMYVVCDNFNWRATDSMVKVQV